MSLSASQGKRIIDSFELVVGKEKFLIVDETCSVCGAETPVDDRFYKKANSFVCANCKEKRK